MDNTLGILVAIIIFGIMLKFVKVRGVVNLALRKFEVNRDPNAEDVVIIEGRKTGLISWILVKLQLGNTFQILVKKDHISYTAESLAGKEHVLVPLQKVSSTACGYKKPIIWFLIGGLLIIGGIASLFANVLAGILLILLGIGCFALYVFMKSFFISIETFGSSTFGFAFKRSFIENEAVDIEKIEEAITLINNMVKEAK